jgi:hypothetical protein
MPGRRWRVVLVSLIGIAAVTVTVAVASWMPIRLRLYVLLGIASAEDVQVFPDTWYRRIDVPAGEHDLVELAALLSMNCHVTLVIPGDYNKIPETKIRIASDMRQTRPENVISVLRENGWRLRRSKAQSGSLVYTLRRSD